MQRPDRLDHAAEVAGIGNHAVDARRVVLPKRFVARMRRDHDDRHRAGPRVVLDRGQQRQRAIGRGRRLQYHQLGLAAVVAAREFTARHQVAQRHVGVGRRPDARARAALREHFGQRRHVSPDGLGGQQKEDLDVVAHGAVPAGCAARNACTSGAVCSGCDSKNRWPSSIRRKLALGISAARIWPFVGGTIGSSRPDMTSVGWRRNGSHHKLVQPISVTGEHRGIELRHSCGVRG